MCALIGLRLLMVCCWCLIYGGLGLVFADGYGSLGFGFAYCGFVWFVVVIIVGCSCIVAIPVVCFWR